MYQIETKRDNRVSYNSFFLWLSLVTKHHNPSTFPRSSNLGRTCWKEKKLLRFPEWKNVILTRCPVLLCLDSHLQSLSYSCVCLTAITVTIHTPKTTQFCVAYLIQLGTVEFNSFTSYYLNVFTWVHFSFAMFASVQGTAEASPAEMLVAFGAHSRVGTIVLTNSAD